MSLYTDAEISCWWDFNSCPIPINSNPFVVLNNIQKALNDKGYNGPISIKVYGDIGYLPLSVRLPVSDLHVGYVAGTDMMEKMGSWAWSHPAPASVLLISGSDIFTYTLKQLENRGYNIMVVKLRSAFELKPDGPWLWKTWETLSTGEDSSSSVCPRIFDRNSLLVVMKIFKYLNASLGSKQHSITPTKGKTTVVIIFRDKGLKTTKTSLKYASYYEKMGWKPALVCVDTSSALRVLSRNPYLARIPFLGIPVGLNLKLVATALDEIKSYIESCMNEHDLIIVDISIFIKLERDKALREKVHRVSQALGPDFVLFAVKSSCISYVHGLSHVEAGLIINIGGNIANKGIEFLDRFTWPLTPIVFVERGGNFEAFDLQQMVLLLLGACNFTVFVNDYAFIKWMHSYCMELKERLCPRHSEIANEELDAELGPPNDIIPNKILKATYRLWSSTSLYEKKKKHRKKKKKTSICEDCYKRIQEWRATM